MTVLLILGLVALLAGLAGYFWSKAQKADAGAEQALREFAALLPALKDTAPVVEPEPEPVVSEPVAEPEPAPYVVLEEPADVPPEPEPVAAEPEQVVVVYYTAPVVEPEPEPVPTPEPYEPSRFIAALAHASRSITRMVTSTPQRRTSHRHRHRHRQG